MKKPLKLMTFVMALGVLFFSNLQVSRDDENQVKINLTDNTAEAQDDPYTRACDRYCLPSGELCVLDLLGGSQLYCIFWEEPPTET